MHAPRPSFLAVFAACFTLVGCAADQDQPYRPPSRPDKPRPTIFLSPAGQPFRAAAGQPYPVARWFAQVDRDHDGHISREEFRADFEAFFRTLDSNHDGVIDGFELDNYEQKVAPEILSVLERPRTDAAAAPANDDQGMSQRGGEGRRGRQSRGGDGQQQGGGDNSARLSVLGASAYSLLNVSEPVASADANFDGKISLTEFLSAADRRFDMLDAKKLGYLTLEGLPRTPDQVAIQGKKPAAP